MTAVSEDATADLNRRIAELEQRLETALIERDAAIERQTASALVSFRLQSELRATADRQNASAEILHTISSAPGDAGRSLQQIAETSARLFGAPSVSIQLVKNGDWGQAYRFGDSATRVRAAVPLGTIRIGGPNLPGTVVAENRQIHLPDLDNLDPAFAHWPGPPHARAAGTRTMCGTPLRRGDEAIGVLIVYRDRLAPFTAEELTLQQSFADQAVIAIENARLFNETQESLERQTATAEILRVISQSPTDVKPVFDAIVRTIVRLLHCDRAFIIRCEGATYLTVATAALDGSFAEIGHSAPIDRAANFPSRAILDKRTLYYPDWSVIELPDRERHLRETYGISCSLFLPLLRDQECIGLLALVGKQSGMFGDNEIALAESFRDQAQIAIENVRLFNETQEALERQTATADILKVIASSPSDVQPVFDAIAERSNQLVSGLSTSVLSLLDDALHMVAYTKVSPAADAALQAYYPQPLSTFAWGETVRRGEIIRIPDSEDEAFTPAGVREVARARGWRSAMLVPLLRDQKPIGMISVTRRETGLFADHHIQLLQTFADQAVIAIENTRLFNETQEALERQTATADILKVIASSPSDVQPVFDAIAASANRLIGGYSTAVHRIIDDIVHLVAFTPIDPEADEALRAAFPLPVSEWPSLALVQHGEIAQIADAEAADPQTRRLGRARGWRSVTNTPLMSQGAFIGFIACTRLETGVLADHHVQLLQTFADQAVIAIENTRLFNETKEALERQTATAEILKVIASSPSDTAPVFEAIAGSAKRLLGGFAAAVFGIRDGIVHLAAFTPTRPAADEALKADFPRPVDEFEGFRLAQHGKPFPIPDTEELPHAPIREIARLHGFRSMLYVPLMNGGIPIGILTVTRVEPGAFAPHHVQLLQTFADQAVIAIENTRLFNETREALERQTATSDILKVIASSPSDVQPVFEAIVNSAAKLFEPCSATITTLKDGKLHWNAIAEIVPSFDHAAAEAQYPISFDPDRAPSARAILERRIIAIPDTNAPDTPEYTRKLAAAGGFRNIMFVPLIHESNGIGTIILTHPQPGFRLSDKQLALVQTFADQAVIAIQNSRLFNEVQERTLELTEALEQQTATSEVLSVISSSAGDLAPVFDAMLAKAMQLCSASFGVLNTHDGKLFHSAATYGLPPAYDEYRRRQPLEYGPGTAPARLLQGEPFVEIDDLLESEAYRRGDANRLALVDLGGARCLLAVPLLKDDRVVGNVMIFRQENRPFSKKQVALLQQFAAQAVIAIENTRLLRELRESTEDLRESLQQQTATADVLKVISRSAFDLQAVLETLIESAVKLAGAPRGVIFLRDGELMRVQAQSGFAPPFLEFLRENPIQRGRGTFTGRAFQDGKVTHMPDVLAEPEFDFHLAPQIGGFRSALAVPLLRNGVVAGVFSIVRPEPGPFTDRQIELVQTFADQAVIAIENVRLFDEVQAKTRDLTEALTYQTGSANILNVIASSPTDVGPVLKAIVDSACELCEAYDAAVALKDGDYLRFSAHHGPIPIGIEKWPINRRWTAGRAFIDKQPVHLADLRDERNADFSDGRELALRMGHRSILSVPLLRDRESIGAIVLRRTEVHPFSEKQIALLQTFADQAVIAIGNVRLFDEVQARTRELAKSLDDLRTAQDRLVQTEKLASLGQLTAGIAHEIKNPLNFVNNFAALSAELTDELKDVLKPAVLDETMRAEVDEITGTLKDNLGKVVQHGKRADSIVKNMLLHSREGTGDHRPTDINALVDESLNLAYHGARAEKPHFNVTLLRNFDPEAGMIEVFPQEITRVLLNLVSNGFYAVSKRKADNGDGSFEPAVTATTKGGSDHVEIRIRDNGTGIPADVKEKMFNPFFTTKPAGEGTGLGLSMSHDIIVKQHGGTIDVDTLQGEFTEFTIVLPRTSNLSSKSRG